MEQIFDHRNRMPLGKRKSSIFQNFEFWRIARFVMEPFCLCKNISFLQFKTYFKEKLEKALICSYYLKIIIHLIGLDLGDRIIARQFSRPRISELGRNGYKDLGNSFLWIDDGTWLKVGFYPHTLPCFLAQLLISIVN